MGIKGLTKLLYDKAPGSIKETDIKKYIGRMIAIDAPMLMYQFMSAVRLQDGYQLSNESGETTSHLIGFLYRTTKMLEVGIRPVYVFDGKPPSLKTSELYKRSDRKAKAEVIAERSLREGDIKGFNKFARRAINITADQLKECQELLSAMGIPYIIVAPGEAEAQCAALVKAGKVYAAGSEDMDLLTFGSPITIRRLSSTDFKKLPILEINLNKALEELQLSYDQFVDMCILLGCDYCDTIKGIGPQKAFHLIKEKGSISEVLSCLDKKKYSVPQDFPYQDVQFIFKNPTLTSPEQLDEFKWNKPDKDRLYNMLVKDKNFNEDRLNNVIKRLESLSSSGTQVRLELFFGGKPNKDTNERKRVKYL